MKSETQPRWLIRVSGNPGVLNDVAGFLSPLRLGIFEQGGERFLASPRFDALSEARAVLDLAKELLSVVDGMLSMTTGGPGHLKVATVLETNDEGRPPSQYVFPESVSSESRVGIPTVHRAGDPLPRKEEHLFHRLLDLASSDDRVWRVLRLMGSRTLDWSTLYRIYEIVDSDVEGTIWSKGWASRASVILFRRTANHPAASGDEARHGEQSEEPPAEPMDIETARSLIRDIVDKWLKEKFRKPSV